MKLIISIVIQLFSLLSFAEYVDSVGVICNKPSATEIEVVDLFDPSVFSIDLAIIDRDNVNVALEKFNKETNNEFSLYLETIQKDIIQDSKKVLIDDWTEFAKTYPKEHFFEESLHSDSKHVYKSQCDVYQLMVFDSEKKTIFYNKKYWEQMSVEKKTVAYTHLILYYLGKDVYGHKNSALAREFTQALYQIWDYDFSKKKIKRFKRGYLDEKLSLLNTFNDLTYKLKDGESSNCPKKINFNRNGLSGVVIDFKAERIGRYKLLSSKYNLSGNNKIAENTINNNEDQQSLLKKEDVYFKMKDFNIEFSIFPREYEIDFTAKPAREIAFDFDFKSSKEMVADIKYDYYSFNQPITNSCQYLSN